MTKYQACKLDLPFTLKFYCHYVDIDECSSGAATCEDHCTNTYGSYLCYCSTGFEKDPEGKTCIGIYMIFCRVYLRKIMLDLTFEFHAVLFVT